MKPSFLLTVLVTIIFAGATLAGSLAFFFGSAEVLVPRAPEFAPASAEEGLPALAQRVETPNLFPFVTNLYLEGPRYVTYLCQGEEVQDLNVCCNKRCHADPQCTAWVRIKGPGLQEDNICELSNTTKYEFNWHIQWHYTEFRNGSQLTMEDLLPEPSFDVLEKLREELRSFKKPCPVPDAVKPQNLSAVKEWLAWAEKQPNGQRKSFLNEGFIVATKVCHDPSRETGTYSQEPLDGWTILQADDSAELSPSLEDLYKDWNNKLPDNGDAYQIVRRPECPPDIGGNPWDFFRLPMLYSKDIPKESKFEGVAVIADDLWENMGHSGMCLFFVDTVLKSFKSEEPLEVVKTVRSAGNAISDFTKGTIEAFQSAWTSESAAKRLLLHQPLAQMKGKSRTCYKAAIQRITQWPVDPSLYDYRKRLLSHCSLPDLPISRKVLVHHKDGIHRDFLHKDWAFQLLGGWAKSHNLEIIFTPLSGLSFCDQVKIFADTAVYLFPHGAGGIHIMSMPAKAVAMEIQQDWTNSGIQPRAVSHGFYAGLAAGSGVLHTRLRRVIPMGGNFGNSGWNNYPKHQSVDWANDVLPILEILWKDWMAEFL